MIELEVRGSDDGLSAVVGFWGHRNDRLWSVFRIGFFTCPLLGAAGIKGRKILSRSVVDDLGAIEGRTLQDPGPVRPEPRPAPESSDHGDVTQRRLREPLPGKIRPNEDVRPEQTRTGNQLERCIPARPDQVGEVMEKDPMPGLQSHQESRYRGLSGVQLVYGFYRQEGWLHELGRKVSL
jgi:hypothetical protein